MMDLPNVRKGIRWRGVLCALVFLFAWQVKVVVYTGSSDAKATPVKYSKLWRSGQKMNAPALQSRSRVPVWTPVYGCLLSSLQSTWVHTLLSPPPARDLARHHLPYFFKPPPPRV